MTATPLDRNWLINSLRKDVPDLRAVDGPLSDKDSRNKRYFELTHAGRVKTGEILVPVMRQSDKIIFEIALAESYLHYLRMELMETGANTIEFRVWPEVGYKANDFLAAVYSRLSVYKIGVQPNEAAAAVLDSEVHDGEHEG